jgi:carbamate kinase
MSFLVPRSVTSVVPNTSDGVIVPDSNDKGTIVVALGGNALTQAGQAGTYREMCDNARVMASSIVELVDAGWKVVVTHGNGPQVGSLAVQQIAAASQVPAQPLFSLVAMTQGQLGSLLTLALQENLDVTKVITVLTHVIVDVDDAAFSAPAKPIGPFYEQAEAARITNDLGWTMVEDSGRGYRRVVASPQPLGILEADGISVLAASGSLVIACGGGGIPVTRTPTGYRGVDAVVDKDYAAQRLASAIDATTLVMVTGVDAVAIDFGTPQQRTLHHLSVAEAERYRAEGQFPPGSMGPKVESAVRFVREGGRMAVITSPEKLGAALSASNTTTGTRIVPSSIDSKKVFRSA